MEEGYKPFLAKMKRHSDQSELPIISWDYETIENESTYEKVSNLMNQGKSQKEVSEALNLNKGSVSKYVSQARSEGKLLI